MSPSLFGNATSPAPANAPVHLSVPCRSLPHTQVSQQDTSSPSVRRGVRSGIVVGKLSSRIAFVTSVALVYPGDVVWVGVGR